MLVACAIFPEMLRGSTPVCARFLSPSLNSEHWRWAAGVDDRPLDPGIVSSLGFGQDFPPTSNAGRRRKMRRQKTF